MSPFLQLNSRDNVAVSLRALAAGDIADGVQIIDAIPVGHKLALKEIQAGEPVFKYGFPIGQASRNIRVGEHVHSHNLKSGLEAESSPIKSLEKVAPPLQEMSFEKPATFLGYRRADGRVGIRNEIWIINTVACVNLPSEKIATMARQKHVVDGGNIDGIFAFSHPYGCSQLGEDMAYTQRLPPAAE